MGTAKKDDKLVFSDKQETDISLPQKNIHQYKLLIVDDEKEVHIMTKLVLSDYLYMGSSLQFLSAYSLPEAKKLIKDHPDAACVLLDVVMETKDAGLEIARFIREDEKNELLRIILRTGQPGKAPEKDIILNYDINDYKEKTELTSQKLFTTITTALRSYIHIIELDDKRKEIATKNVRLNEEIARRIVAEHNLTKYNRSLEKVLDSKSAQLKTSLIALELKKKELQGANKLAAIGDISSITLSQLNLPEQNLEQNLATIDKYRTQITQLLEKYENLQEIIDSHIDPTNSGSQAAHESLNQLNQLKQDIDLDMILTQYPEIILNSTKGIECIYKAINDIRLFITVDDGTEELTDINTVLKSSIKKVSVKFDKNIDIQSHFDELPKINITPTIMGQALCEIIKNAFQAVTSKGIISIFTEYKAPNIILHISDIGCGISAEDHESIFKPYFTKNKSSTARGLGLCFAKAVIKNNGGSIEISSKPNEGTTVSISLPEQPNPTQTL